MLRFMGWVDAADVIINAMEKTILNKFVTHDFGRQMDDAVVVRDHVIQAHASVVYVLGTACCEFLVMPCTET